MPAPLSGALAQAVERHKLTWRALNSGVIGGEDIPDHLIDAESEALWHLATLPCADDGELLAKLRYLVAYEKGVALGRAFDMSAHGSLPIALDLYFTQGA